MSCVSSSEYFFVLVNDVHIGDPLEANKTQEICILLMNTLTSCRINPLLSSMYRSYSRIPQSKSMHIMPRGHIVADPSIFTRISEGSTFDLYSSSVVRSLIVLFVFRSNPITKVYQHRSRNGRIMEVA